MTDGLAEVWTLAALIGDGAVRTALTATADWPLAVWLRRSATAYIWFNAGHILSIGLLLGSILLLDLRLLGFFRSQPLEALCLPLATMAMLGAAATIGTGFLIFTVRPDAYLGNAAFLVKLALLTLALANAMALRLTVAWRDPLDFGEVAPPSASPPHSPSSSGQPPCSPAAGSPFSRPIATEKADSGEDDLPQTPTEYFEGVPREIISPASSDQTTSRPSGSGSWGHIGWVIFL